MRFIHAPGNHEDCIKHIADEQIETDAAIKTDGHAAYNARTLKPREHDVKVQSADLPEEMTRIGRSPVCKRG